MRYGINSPAPGHAPGPGWHRQLLDGIQSDGLVSTPDVRISRGTGGARVRLRRRARPGFGAATVALTQSVANFDVTLSAGFMILRGAIITVAEQTLTLAAGTNYLWLQFTITPSITTVPTLQTGSSWPTVNLATHGWIPMAQWTRTTGDHAYARLDTLYHPGGNLQYAVD